jgi:hypothetical protein
MNEIVDEGEEVFVLPLLAGWCDLLGGGGGGRKGWPVRRKRCTTYGLTY